MLKPLVEALMRAVGKPKAKVMVCSDPVLGGISQALRWERVEEIIQRYRGMVDLFLECVDRDGEAGRRQRLDQLEEKSKGALAGTDRHFLAECAWQEVEVWVLAGHDLPSDWSWSEVRREPNAKEEYFEPFAKAQGVWDAPAGGRGILAREAAARFDRVLKLCPEDLGVLDQRVRDWLEEGNA